MLARAWQETDGTFKLGNLREGNKEAIYKGVAGMVRLTRDSESTWLAVMCAGSGRSSYQNPEAMLHPGSKMESAIQQK